MSNLVDVTMHETLRSTFRSIAPAVEFCSLRYYEESSERLSVRRGTVSPPELTVSCGAMITVVVQGAMGCAASSDLSPAGLSELARKAQHQAELVRGRALVDHRVVSMPRSSGQYASRVARSTRSVSLGAKYGLLREIAAACPIDPRIVDWGASLWTSTATQAYFTADGAEIEQQFHRIMPRLSVTAYADGESQTRTRGGDSRFCRQGGVEVLEAFHAAELGLTTADEALSLLGAPNCPTGEMDLVLMPDQMLIQIHESIGHALELDRILGDERNFAGRSFVTPDMFGSFAFGSPLLNVTHDPSRIDQFASSGWDDEGAPAVREAIISGGILQRALGSAVSRARVPGVPVAATARAPSWNRSPIDRIGNLNLEVGASSFEQLVGSIERGVVMSTNSSWSIDDSRNNFQFGCEWGRVIRDGRLGEIVKNPGYRGRTVPFWRSLSAVGDAATFEVMGAPACGKGEPAARIGCGHASPACKFSGVSVFGGLSS